MTNLEVEDFVRNIKGAAASVLWYLVLAGTSATARHLQRVTGYSDKPITDALAWLEPRRLVQYNGRHNGWSIGTSFHQPAIPFTHSQPSPSVHSLPSIHSEDRRNSDQPRILEDRKNSEHRNNSDLPDHIVVAVDDHYAQDSNNQQQQQDQQAGRKNSELAAILGRLGIRGRAQEELTHLDHIQPEHVLAWHCYALTQTWLNNPSGYVICRLRERQTAPDDFLALVLDWPGLDEEERSLLHAAATGIQDGRRFSAPADDWHAIRYSLGDELPQLGPPALNAYLKLVKVGVDAALELDPIGEGAPMV